MAMNELRNDFRPPFAGILQILRATGYNFLSSILELVDNSISKDASNIRILLYDDRICVLDDATGMDLKQLCEAFVIANIKNDRDATDIGKFHVGMKSAIMNMGNTIVILSKVVGGGIVGIMVDIEVMKDNNSYNPTEIVANVTADWAISHGIKADLFAEFVSQDSGTLVHVRHLLPKCSMPYDVAKSELKRGIAISYSNLRPNCKIWIGNNIPGDPLPLIDLFYSDDEVIGNQDKPTEHLEFAPYETVLHVYAPESKSMPARIIERNTTKREIRKGEKTSGTPERPTYYEYCVLAKNGQKHSNITPIVELPTTKLLGVIPIRVIQLKKEVLEAEGKTLDGLSFLDGHDRKGFYFKRSVRTVGVAKRLGKKIYDRTTTSAERQRMLVEFSADLDEIIGSKFNKQMDDQALPSQVLTDALFNIYRQITVPWADKTTRKEASEAARADANSTTTDYSIAGMLKRKPVKDKDAVSNDLTDNTGAETEAVAESEATAETEAVAESEATAETEAVAETEAAAETEAVAESETSAETETAAETKAVAETDAAAETKAVAEPPVTPTAPIDADAPVSNPTPNTLEMFGVKYTVPVVANPAFNIENGTDGYLLSSHTHGISIKVRNPTMSLLDWLNTLTSDQIVTLSAIV